MRKKKEEKGTHIKDMVVGLIAYKDKDDVVHLQVLGEGSPVDFLGLGKYIEITLPEVLARSFSKRAEK